MEVDEAGIGEVEDEAGVGEVQDKAEVGEVEEDDNSISNSCCTSVVSLTKLSSLLCLVTLFQTCVVSPTKFSCVL